MKKSSSSPDRFRDGPVPIFPHANFNRLLEALSGEWITRPVSPSPQPVIVPSLPFSDYLQLRIAQECGVCMGFDFLMPQDFVSRALGRGENSWSKSGLCWRILPHVGTFAHELGVASPPPRDRLSIAGLLAERFDQYGHFRPEIFRAWANGKSALKSTASGEAKAHEIWQRELWRKLNEEIRSPHPALEWERLNTDKTFRERMRADFPKLLVLGSGSIDPLLVEVLGVLASAGCDVRIHVVLPSLGYLGDLKRRNEPLPSEDNDPESLAVAGGHPLLESMGRHAVGSFLLLGKLDEQFTHWPLPTAPEESGGSLLHRLQSDICGLVRPAAGETFDADISLRVHSCFGARREMEVLRDEILRAFRDIPDLKPEEIHIVTPSLETYAPLVPAVLERGGIRLPVRVTELPPSGRDPVIEGALALLQMSMSGRFEASWIMELLHMRAVREALGIADDEKGLERLRGWIRQSGLTQGLGGEEPGTWIFARDRLIAGRWFGPEDSAKYPDGDFVLPVADRLGGDGDLRDHFIAWHARLEKTMREWGQEATPAGWGARLDRACGDLLSGKDETRLAIQPHLAFLRGLDCPEETDAGSLFDWLESEIRESGLRTSVSGAITFSRFKQLQNIPCRVLAMVGMQDGQFPGQNRVPDWDLLQSAPRAWDRNPRVDDRQLFLDALLTPSERLVITAANRNVRSGKEEPFSSCVDELLRVAGAMGAPKSRLIVKHRLQPFASGYFDGSLKLPPSFDPEHAAAATALAAGNKPAGFPFWTGEKGDAMREPGGFLEIPMTDLAGFWADPAGAFLRAQGIALERDAEDDEELDRAPITLSALQTWNVKHAVLEDVVAATATLAHTEAQLRADRGLPPGRLGSRTWQTSRELGEPLGNGVKKNRGGEFAVAIEIPGQCVRVTGSLLEAKDAAHLLAYRIGAFKSPGHYLAPWIQAAVAAASGRPMPLRLLDEASPDQGNELPPINPEEAKVVLASLVRGFLQGRNTPLSYAPATSHVCAKNLEKTGDPDSAVAAAAEAWHKEAWQNQQAGDGHAAAARIAWRDLDPFADPAAWIEWTEAIAIPLKNWGGFK